MSQLQKRCLAASLGFHGTLLLILLAGSAFFLPTKEAEKTEYLQVIPSNIIDDALAGGGGDPTIPKNNEREKGDTLVPQPPKAEVTPPPPVKPKDPPVRPKDPPAEKAQPTEKTAPTPKPAIKLSDLVPVTKRPKETASNTSKTKEDARSKEIAQSFANAADALKQGFVQGTTVKVSGTGGPAYANYASVVRAVYDDAWFVSDDVSDDNTTTTVEIVIARDGDVIRSRIVKRSGNRGLDASVERTLASVKFVRAFPASWTEQQKTFTINFNLKSKRAAG